MSNIHFYISFEGLNDVIHIFIHLVRGLVKCNLNVIMYYTHGVRLDDLYNTHVHIENEIYMYIKM